MLREVERAVNKKKTIIPIIVGKFTLSKSLEYFVSSHHWLELFKQNNRDQLNKLAAIIKKKLAGQQDSIVLQMTDALPATENSFFSQKAVLPSLLILSFGLCLWLFFHFFLHHTGEQVESSARIASPKTTQPSHQTGKKETSNPDTIEGEVFDVPNGNGVKVRINGKELEIRLYGIDAPAPQQEYSKTAQRFLEDLLVDRKVRANLLGTDDHGHTLALASSGGKNLNKAMVQAGYAWKNSKHCRHEPFCSELGQLEQQARAKRLGLWQSEHPVPPWEWRR